MKLQTIIKLEKQKSNLIDYHSNILLLGSCFVENIGNKLEYFKFQSIQNPFGILFHPKAIETLIYNSLSKKIYSNDDVFFHNEQWHCFDTHSKLSNSNTNELLTSLNENLDLTSKSLHKATHIIITLGTAWIYRDVKSNLAVANCHKVPQNKFVKELLSVEDVSYSLKMMRDLIQKVNPKATLIFTISPIRHVKDGFIENTQSKAHLISALHNLLNRKSDIENRNLFYFPSYEIMLDELRDYRFYAEDMIHPNGTAINYIWERFQEVWIASESEKIMLEVDAVQKGIRHKAFNESSEAHQKFLRVLESKKTELSVQFPHIFF